MMENLRIIRKNAKLTQNEVADRLDIKRTTYASYENTTNEPNIETLKKLADFYGVSLDYLCGRQFNNQIGYIPDDIKETFKKILLLKDRQVNMVDAYVTALLDENNNNKLK